jgi:hypothetical protein
MIRALCFGLIVFVGCARSAPVSPPLDRDASLPPVCVTGESAPCTCPDGASGAQTCDESGQFGACVCLHPDVSFRRLRLTANDLISAPARGILYASRHGGDSVLAIDPKTGAITATIAVGGEPGPLALSDDGRYLYVGLTSIGAVRRIDLTASVATDQLSLGAELGPNGTTPLQPKGLIALPGRPESFVVSRARTDVSPDFAGIYVYDGVRVRGSTLSPPFDGPSDLAALNDSTLFGFDRGAATLYTLRVSDSGVAVSNTSPIIESPFAFYGVPFGPLFRDTFVYDGGLLFCASGQVVDPLAGTEVGRYPASGPVLPDRAAGRTYFLKSGNGSTSLVAFDRTTFASLGEAILPFGTAVEMGAFVSLVRWSHGVAFHHRDGDAAFSEDAIYIVEAKIVP